jgi:cyanophycinase
MEKGHERNGHKRRDAIQDTRGALLVIGGHESKQGDQHILEEVARRAGGGKLVIATIASEEPKSQWDEYKRVFGKLGVRDIAQLDVRRREELLTDSHQQILEHARVIFFAGGDQMNITSRLGGTALCDTLRSLYRKGAMIAGTSAGASVLSEVMITSGDSDTSSEVGRSLEIAPGLGLISGMIIDQHFAQRGRIGRLLGVVAQNPRVLGVGVDEDTAFLIERNEQARVLGSGAVYVLDAREMTYTNSARDESGKMSAFGVKLHVLSADDSFNLETREPKSAEQK